MKRHWTRRFPMPALRRAHIQHETIRHVVVVHGARRTRRLSPAFVYARLERGPPHTPRGLRAGLDEAEHEEHFVPLVHGSLRLEPQLSGGGDERFDGSHALRAVETAAHLRDPAHAPLLQHLGKKERKWRAKTSGQPLTRFSRRGGGTDGNGQGSARVGASSSRWAHRDHPSVKGKRPSIRSGAHEKYAPVTNGRARED